jgi:hypothetical protein
MSTIRARSSEGVESLFDCEPCREPISAQIVDRQKDSISHRLYYGHFFCHGFHQDYIISKGHDTVEIEHRMRALLDSRGAQYLAEHNIGHLYEAKPTLVSHYNGLDPAIASTLVSAKPQKMAAGRLAAMTLQPTAPAKPHHDGVIVIT